MTSSSLSSPSCPDIDKDHSIFTCMFLAIFVIKITIIIIPLHIFCCPDRVCGQLNRWPCHWLTESLTQWATFWFWNIFWHKRATLETCDLWDIWSEQRHKKSKLSGRQIFTFRTERQHGVLWIFDKPIQPQSLRVKTLIGHFEFFCRFVLEFFPVVLTPADLLW